MRGLRQWQTQLLKWGIHFDLPGKREKIQEIEAIMQEPNFWDDAEKSQGYMKELKNLKDAVADYDMSVLPHKASAMKLQARFLQVGFPHQLQLPQRQMLLTSQA